MNRTGLVIALILAVVIGVGFGIHPEWDLKLAALFYDPAIKDFPLRINPHADFLRDAAMWIAWAFALPAIVAFFVKMFRAERPLIMSGRAMVLLMISMLMAAGFLTNLTFKSFWSRPRPVMVTEFNGPLPFVPWWDPRGRCTRNCSFMSGESATAFWTLAPAALAPPAWRPLAYAAAVTFGLLTSGLRMAFGGHFFTDAAIAGLSVFLMIWLLHGLLYRWRWPRITDAKIDAALTRLAWPGYRIMQRWRGRDVGPRPPLP